MSGNRPFLCTPDRVAYFRAGPKKPRQKASRRQSQIDPRSFVATGFLILATSLAKEEFPASEVLAVYRPRWQIELAFKRLKSLPHIDKPRTKTEVGTRWPSPPVREAFSRSACCSVLPRPGCSPACCFISIVGFPSAIAPGSGRVSDRDTAVHRLPTAGRHLGPARLTMGVSG
jgi:hypothetical protein